MDSSSCLYRDAIAALTEIEKDLRNHILFKHLGVSIIPVGSVFEGTKLGLPDELDVSLFMKNTDGLLSYNENDFVRPLEVRKGKEAQITTLGLDRWLQSNQKEKFDPEKFFEDFLVAIYDSVQKLDLALLQYLRIEKGRPNTCEETSCLKNKLTKG